MHEWLQRMDDWRESRFHFSIYSPLRNPYFTLNSFLAEKITKKKIEKLLKQLIGVHYKCLALYLTLLDVAGSGIQFHTLTWPVPSPVRICYQDRSELLAPLVCWISYLFLQIWRNEPKVQNEFTTVRDQRNKRQCHNKNWVDKIGTATLYSKGSIIKIRVNSVLPLWYRSFSVLHPVKYFFLIYLTVKYFSFDLPPNRSFKNQFFSS